MNIPENLNSTVPTNDEPSSSCYSSYSSSSSQSLSASDNEDISLASLLSKQNERDLNIDWREMQYDSPKFYFKKDIRISAPCSQPSQTQDDN